MPINESEWKQIAIYLASCHAATAEHTGMLRTTSKSSRRRFASICEKAATMLASGVATHAGGLPLDDIVGRLRSACRDINNRAD